MAPVEMARYSTRNGLINAIEIRVNGVRGCGLGATRRLDVGDEAASFVSGTTAEYAPVKKPLTWDATRLLPSRCCRTTRIDDQRVAAGQVGQAALQNLYIILE
jgi:hypothetical protein